MNFSDADGLGYPVPSLSRANHLVGVYGAAYCPARRAGTYKLRGSEAACRGIAFSPRKDVVGSYENVSLLNKAGQTRVVAGLWALASCAFGASGPLFAKRPSM